LMRSSVWVLFALFVLAVGWSAFTDHSPAVEQTLVSLGLRIYHIEYRVDPADVLKRLEHIAHLRGPLEVETYLPNTSMVFVYIVAAAVVCAVASRSGQASSSHQASHRQPNRTNRLVHGNPSTPPGKSLR